MKTIQVKKNILRKKRAMRVRKSLKGSSDKPRMSVSKTNCHLFVQLIDDENRVTIAGIGTRSKENKDTEFNRKSKDSARHLGTTIAKLAKEKNIKKVIFDRGRFKYHGLIALLADSARKEGLQF